MFDCWPWNGKILFSPGSTSDGAAWAVVASEANASDSTDSSSMLLRIWSTFLVSMNKGVEVEDYEVGSYGI